MTQLYIYIYIYTTEVTAESVNWNNERCFEDDTTDAIDTLTMKNKTSASLSLPSPHDPNRAN